MHTELRDSGLGIGDWGLGTRMRSPALRWSGRSSIFFDTGALADGLFQANLEPLAPNAQRQPAINADEVIGNPDKGKPAR